MEGEACGHTNACNSASFLWGVETEVPVQINCLACHGQMKWTDEDEKWKAVIY
jgi:hypothetical protein